MMNRLSLILWLGLITPALAQHRVSPHSPRQAEPSPRSQARISSRVEFDRLARTYYQGRFYALPHLMFVIDRAAQGRIYYINSQRYAFHKDFVNANYL